MNSTSSFLFLAVALTSARASAQCDTWSAAFAPGGLNDTVHAFIVHDDGSGPALYAGGEFDEAAGVPVGHVARWNGERWTALPSTLSGVVRAFAVHDDGSGSKLYAGGLAVLPGADVASWDGTSWSALPGSSGQNVLCMTAFDGSLYTGGHGGLHIQRWTGSGWFGVGGVVGNYVHALAVHDDGSGSALYVGGSFAYSGGLVTTNVSRWNGSHWSTVGGGTTNTIQTFAVHDFGAGPRLVAGGATSTFPKVEVWDGSAWTATTAPSTLGSGSFVHELVSLPGGAGDELYAAGRFALSSGGPEHDVARLDGSTWTPLGTGIQGAAVLALARFDDGSGAQLFAGGDFQNAGSVHVEQVARWDGTAWASANTSQHVDGTRVNAITRFGGDVYVAGSFSGAGDADARSIARFDGADWSGVGAVVGEVHSLCVFDDGSGEALYAGGVFTKIGGVNANSIARWDGSTWAFPPHPIGEYPTTQARIFAMAVHDDGSGPALYVAGDLYTTHFGARYSVARYRDAQWTAVGAGGTSTCVFPGVASSLAVHDDGTGPALYMGGTGLQWDCIQLHGVARWDGSSWSSVGGGVSNAPSSADVFALRVHDDGNGPALYAAGAFHTAGGNAASNVARWKDGAWSPVGGGTDATVLALASIDAGDGRGPALVAGGRFAHAGGVECARIARFVGGGWEELADGVSLQGSASSSVRSMLAIEEASVRQLYVGGVFDRAGAQPVRLFARLDGCAETGRTYCYGDGSATPCPCGNASAVGARAGCLHSLGSGGTLRGRGVPSLSDDTLALDGGSMTTSFALYFQAANVANGELGVAFGDGLRCTNGPYVRLLAKTNVGGASTYPESGDLSVSAKGLVTVPGTRRYQVRYRNPAAFCTVETFNYTNALEIVWRN